MISNIKEYIEKKIFPKYKTESIQKPDYLILKDKSKNDFLVNNGYITLPILDEAKVNQLKKLYEKWHPSSPESFYKSYFSNNKGYKKEVENTVIEICKPALDKFFNDYIPYGAMFVVKPPGNDGHIPPHQDWSFVDETKHWSLNMWLPLKDVDSKSGTIRFLPGSHFFMKTIRGANTPELYTHLTSEIEENLVDIPLKAGEAVFFYHGIVHCSHINKEKHERVCVGTSLVQKKAPLYFHLLNQGESYADKYSVDLDFFFDYAHSRGEIPVNAKHLGKDKYPFSKLSPQELDSKIKEFKNSFYGNAH